MEKCEVNSNYYKQSELNVQTLKLTCETGSFQAGTNLKLWKRKM